MTRRSTAIMSIVLLTAIMITFPLSGCLSVEPDDPDTYIGNAHLLATDINGTIHWEARFVLFMYSGYQEADPWKGLEARVRTIDDQSYDTTREIHQDSNMFTFNPDVSYVDRTGPDDIINKNDVIRVSGISHDVLPLRLTIFWGSSERTNAVIDKIPQVSLRFGTPTTNVVSNGADTYRTILLPVVDMYPAGTKIIWRDLTVNIFNPSGVRIYFNTSLSMRIEEDQPLVNIPPQTFKGPVAIAYVNNDPDAYISPGEALYFPGLHKDMEDSFIEIIWNEDLIGRRILL